MPIQPVPPIIPIEAYSKRLKKETLEKPKKVVIIESDEGEEVRRNGESENDWVA